MLVAAEPPLHALPCLLLETLTAAMRRLLQPQAADCPNRVLHSWQLGLRVAAVSRLLDPEAMAFPQN